MRSIFELAGVAHMQPAWKIIRPEDRATPKQIGWLNKCGIPVPRECTKAQYKRLRGKDEQRRKAGMCRLGGVNWLSWYGIDAWRLTGPVAKKIQREIIANERKPLPPDRLRALMSREPGSDDGAIY